MPPPVRIVMGWRFGFRFRRRLEGEDDGGRAVAVGVDASNYGAVLGSHQLGA
jgi:hypothetical protein